MSRLARLGAFIVATLALLAVGVFIIGSKEYLFRSTYRLRAQFDNVAGLSDGAGVQVGGVHSGTVIAIDLPRTAGGKVTVVMQLEKPTREIIKQDSLASIETEGVLGNQYMAISFGSAGQPEVKDNEILQSLPPLQVADLLKKANVILDSSQQAVQYTTQATQHLSSISAKIDSGQGTIGQLVNDRAVYNNLQNSTASMQATIVHAEAGVTDFQENMEALKHNFLLSGYFKKRGYEDSEDITANIISELPARQPIKTFAFPAKELFDNKDTAKLKDQKALNASGDFLAQNEFGFAVVVVSTGMEGDAQKDLVLSQARAMVIREYLVENFGFDDSQLKTMGIGKPTGANQAAGVDASWGTIQIVIYPTGTEPQGEKNVPGTGAGSPVADVTKPAKVAQ